MTHALFLSLSLIAALTAAPPTPAADPAAPPTAAAAAAADHDEARYKTSAFDPAADAKADVDAALTRAGQRATKVAIVMGGNWCHDSASLAWALNSPRFAAMIGAGYELVYVDVGKPQIGKGRNLDIAKRFGAKKIKGTPTLLILSNSGHLLNKGDAASWRNAASRSDDAIYAYFAEMAAKPGPARTQKPASTPASTSSR